MTRNHGKSVALPGLRYDKATCVLTPTLHACMFAECLAHELYDSFMSRVAAGLS